MRVLVGLIVMGGFAYAAAPPDPSTQNLLNKIPLRFESVRGQNDRTWLARGLGFGVAISGDSAVLGLDQHALQVQFTGADPDARFVGEQKSATSTNHFSRGDFYSSDAFLKLRRHNLYPGIDITYYGVGQRLEYDFELAPGADPSVIRMRFAGANRVQVTPKGALLLSLPGGDITQNPPVTYQRTPAGDVVAVSSSYFPEDDGSYSIRLGEYDAARELVIDPEILFTAYLAGTGADSPISISKDKNGSIYLAGSTYSNNFPLVGEAYSGFILTPNEHIFTTKMNPLKTGDEVIPYSGIFGGDFGDMLKAATVDSEGVLYMTGLTDDFFFPTTSGAYRTENGSARKIFLSALDTKLPGKSGLVYSTFFGGTGTEEPTAIALGGGKAYITGFTYSTDFPVKGAIQATLANGIDIFASVFDIKQTGAASLVVSTYLGGSFIDVPRSIAVDAAGKAYIAGYTYSYDLGATANAFQGTYSGAGDSFLAKLDLLGGKKEYLTFLGRKGIDQAWKVALDAQGRPVVAGFSLSTDFPTTPNAVQTVAGGNGDAFLTVLDINAAPGAQLVYSTLYGGSDGEVINDLRVGPSGSYYFCGYTLSRDLRTVDAINSVSALGGTDGFVAIIDPAKSGSAGLTYSSYVTGQGFQMVNAIEVDATGNVYITGVAYGNVFAAGQDHPPDDSSTNVFLLVFRPTAPPVVRQESGRTPLITRTRR
ncbi:MAG: SBBP repeat-containing protein [Acidobacteriota bacterium]